MELLATSSLDSPRLPIIGRKGTTRKRLSRPQTRRSHEENQERAYTAASRRADRSLEARVRSARMASDIHRRRTGKALKVSDDIVRDGYEEGYDHVAPQFPVPAVQLPISYFDDNYRSHMASLVRYDLINRIFAEQLPQGAWIGPQASWQQDDSLSGGSFLTTLSPPDTPPIREPIPPFLASNGGLDLVTLGFPESSLSTSISELPAESTYLDINSTAPSLSLGEVNSVTPWFPIQKQGGAKDQEGAEYENERDVSKLVDTVIDSHPAAPLQWAGGVHHSAHPSEEQNIGKEDIEQAIKGLCDLEGKLRGFTKRQMLYVGSPIE